jgi:hypothetical protein
MNNLAAFACLGVTTLDFAPLGDALLKAPSAVDSYVY